MWVAMDIESIIDAFHGFRQKTAKPLTIEMIASYSDSELNDHTVARFARRTDLTEQNEVERLPPLVQAWLVTGIFEGQVGNGGLNQYFLNFEDRPWFLDLVLRGYDVLGLPEQRRLIEERIIPVAFSDTENLRRERQRQKPFSRTGVNELEVLDDLIEDQTDLRIRVVRANPELFAG